MPAYHSDLIAWLRTHHGIVSGRELAALGITRASLAAMRDCGELIVVWEGVYRHVFDLSKHLSARDLESVIEQGLRRSLFDIPTLCGVGQLLCRRGRPGAARFAAVLSSRPIWRRPADSHPEIELRRALGALGVQLEPQISLILHDGQTVHPDLGDPTVGFYIEIDDHEWHGGRVDATYDQQRDRLARLVGARIERVSTDEVRSMQPSLVTSLATAYRQQRTLWLSTS
jgi:hypothetical protein